MGPQDYLYAADTTNMQAGGKSIFESIGDAATMGAGSAVVSGFNSIYNTGVDVANYFGADLERNDTARWLGEMDQNWGDYYKANKNVIDTVGFVGTSFIPGGLAVKGLNLLRRGEGAGAFARALNFTSTKQRGYLEAALQDLASTEGTLFTRLNKNTLGALTYGVADNVLQTAAFELATAATMKASPLLDGQSYTDLTYDIAKTSLFGGIFAGGIEGLFMNRITKDASKAISAQGNKYKNMMTAFDKTNLSESDKAYAMMDNVLALPKEVFADDKVLQFAYRLGGQKNSVALDTAKLNDANLEKVVRSAYLKLEDTVNNKIATDPTVGTGIANMLVKLVKDGKAAGQPEDAIRARMGDYLFNLEKVEGATIGSLRPQDLWYFDRSKKVVDKFSTGPFDRDRTSFSQRTVRIIGGDPAALRTTTIGLPDTPLTQTDAWKEGYDMVFRPNGQWSINPASKVIRDIQEPSTIQSFLRLDSGATSDTAVLSAADVATKEGPLQVLGNTVRTGDKQFKFSTERLPAAPDAVENSARHYWASKLNKIEGTVSADDISVLDRMSSAKHVVGDDTVIKLSGVDVPVPWKDLGNFDDWVFQQKVSKLEQLAGKGNFDVTEAAYSLNTTPQWVQDVIASKFSTTLKKQATGAPDLSQGWQRDLASYGQRDTVVLNYKNANTFHMDDYGNTFQVIPDKKLTNDQGMEFLGNIGGHRNFVTGEQAYAYRVRLAQDSLDTAVSSVFGTDAARFGSWTAAELTGRADSLGAGAGLLNFSNADYGDILRLATQDSGKNVHILTQNYTNAVLTRLQPMLAALKNSPVDNAELVAVVTKLRRSAEKYALVDGPDGASYIVDRTLIRGATPADLAELFGRAQTSTQGGDKVFRLQSKLTTDFLKEHMAINAETTGKRKVLLNAQGLTSNISEDTLYVPSIDTRKVPYFAFVRPIEGKIFGDSNVSMITAKNAEELQRLVGQVDQKQFQVIFKKESEAYHKAKGDYDYSRAINESTVDSSLRKDGKLGDYLPSFQPEDVLEDFVQYHQRQQTQLVRDGVSTKYSQTFTELRRLSQQFTDAATSKAEPISKLFQRTVQDPYDDYIKTALDISKRSEFPILHQLNEFVDALGTRAYQAIDSVYRGALKGKITWEEANSTLERFGLPGPYTSEHSFAVAQTIPDRNIIKTALQKANMALANTTLRFDFANSLVNIISTPIMLGTELSSIRRSVANNPEITGKLAELTTVKLPGQDAAIPSMTKLIYNSVGNWWKKDVREGLLERFTANSDVKAISSQYHEALGELSLLPQLIPSQFAKTVDSGVEKLSKITFNNFAETFTRFVSADVMRQLTEPLVAGKVMSLAEQNAYISVFVNRVQGNYIASQRPILFQGTLGSALGLFQTYQFNLLQQLFRHIENRDLKTVAVMGGLQSTLFGLNGLPAFDAINTHIIGSANINPGHRDIYTTVTDANKELGNWMMYGTASAMPLFGGNGPALYTRGDLNPRHATVVPVMPQDVPAVDGTVRFVSNLLNVGKKLKAGGDVSASLLEGLEHNSVSRPLAGVAQALQGYSTTSKGSLISASNDLWSVANASRVLGAKPLDESVGLNAKYRLEAHKAADREAINILGEAVKTKLRGGQAPTDEEFQNFMGKYAAHGGRIDNFSSAMQAWSKDANESILNKLSDQIRSPYGQRFSEVMGGTRFEDLR